MRPPVLGLRNIEWFPITQVEETRLDLSKLHVTSHETRQVPSRCTLVRLDSTPGHPSLWSVSTSASRHFAAPKGADVTYKSAKTKQRWVPDSALSPSWPHLLARL